MIYKMAALVLAAGIVFGVARDVRADDLSKWESDKVRLEEILDRKNLDLSEEQACQEIWNILWPAAKEGNLEARARLFSMIVPVPHRGPLLTLPGSSGDMLSLARDGVILAAHSIGVEYDDPQEEAFFKEWSHRFFSGGIIKETRGGRQFWECVNGTDHSECAKIAVEGNVVPSFEKYAEEKEAFIVSDRKASCSF